MHACILYASALGKDTAALTILLEEQSDLCDDDGHVAPDILIAVIARHADCHARIFERYSQRDAKDPTFGSCPGRCRPTERVNAVKNKIGREWLERQRVREPTFLVLVLRLDFGECGPLYAKGCRDMSALILVLRSVLHAYVRCVIVSPAAPGHR